ncbi:MAG TPA: class I SAM-dependent methyltransferase [Gammaproteobacteria bacterium]|nr:class I SAM-dependent methyltransferase [Gammaproteobacteria bacterium]
MSGFSGHWLALRESADHRSRRDYCGAIELLRAPELAIIDLGCGAGSNFRYLHPRLGPAQRWTCIDNDAALLAALERSLAGQRSESRTVTLEQADLAEHIEALIAATFERSIHPARLVTASALLDLVSAPWIESLAAGLAHARAALWLALTYDGRIELEPRHPLDATLRTLLNAHQLTDKGFGAALGPHAHDFACKTLSGAGFAIREATSDWLLGADDRVLARELLLGWLSAAREHAGDRALLSEWETQRLAQLRSGTLSVRVGHRDLFAMPEFST